MSYIAVPGIVNKIVFSLGRVLKLIILYMVPFPRDNNEETKNSSRARVFTSADRSPLVVIPHAGGRRQVPTLLAVKSVASICRRINQRMVF